ncbi:protein ALTERED PHOSPHATE STARVATION RESPONSE 1-like [Musa acuminata AAA Group]|uniref:protein ALTERED PHOSPHATE STARVATION RESPONSE 1-like n=1 Tax=Musa acuminata AAA Group TaxID=214697 RepID=UPI0031DBFD4F
MGSTVSKPAKDDALLLCKERIKYIKQAIDSRYALSAAHLSYIQSLRSVGAALRQFAEADLLVESSISTSEVEKSPSHSSYASPSPSRFVECAGSPSLSASPLSPQVSNVSYMRATGATAVRVTIDQSATHFVEEDSITFPLPPPPPPSWDFFYPTDAAGSINSQAGECGRSVNVNVGRMRGLRQLKESEVVPLIEEEGISTCKKEMKEDNICLNRTNEEPQPVNLVEKRGDKVRGPKFASTSLTGSVDAIVRIASSEPCGSNMENTKLQKEICPEREDFSEFITHRAKDFVSSMRDIEHRFLRAAEAGYEVSRMLETKKIRLGISSETAGKPPAFRVLAALNHVCCTGETFPKHRDSSQNVTKVITWNRSLSSLSSSSKSPLAAATKDDVGDSSSDFIDEFSMISGSHSSSLERLHAWERKLYDEIKASEHIRKAYDQKCSQLRHQVAQDLSPRLIDKTRAVVKDLHSRVTVAIQSVDSISKRIENMRDEELLPQLVELIQGLIRMWKAMLECHHAQFITISLAYHAKTSTAATHREAYKQALIHLQHEIEYFSYSFSNWINAHKFYVEALSAWLQKCILQPRERRKGRRTIFPPRHAISPPIFVVCNDWLAGLKSVPTEELFDSIKSIVSVIHDSFEQPIEEKQMEKVPDEPEKTEVPENKEGNHCKRYLNLDNLQACLTRAFDWLTKFAEASMRVYEDVKQGNEIARVAYSNAGLR